MSKIRRPLIRPNETEEATLNKPCATLTSLSGRATSTVGYGTSSNLVGRLLDLTKSRTWDIVVLVAPRGIIARRCNLVL